MRKQDYLIQLINTLSPSERRYFKLYSSIQPGEKKYLQLYELLEDKQDYDAVWVASQMGLTAAQLAKLKHYLNQQLFSCLRNYNEQQSEISMLHNARTDVRELMKRRLHDYALELNEKALQRAWQLDQFELITVLLRNKYDCLFNMNRQEELKLVPAENHKVRLALDEVKEMERLDAEGLRIERSGEDPDDFKKLMQHPLLKNKPEKLLTLRGKALWFRVMNTGNRFLCSGAEVCLKIAYAQMELYEKNPLLIEFYSPAYLASFVDLAEAEHAAGNFIKALEWYDEFERKVDGGQLRLSKIRANSMKAYTFVSRMIIYSNMGQFEKVLPEEKKLRPLIGQRSVYEQIDAALTLAIAQVHLRRSDLAIDKLNEMLELDVPERPPHLKTLRPLLMMAQIDLGNYPLIPYLIKSAKSWMKRNKYVEPEYDIFFSLIGTIANPSKNSTRRKEYARLMQTVNDGKLTVLNEAVYLERWVKSKMQN